MLWIEVCITNHRKCEYCEKQCFNYVLLSFLKVCIIKMNYTKKFLKSLIIADLILCFFKNTQYYF